MLIFRWVLLHVAAADRLLTQRICVGASADSTAFTPRALKCRGAAWAAVFSPEGSLVCVGGKTGCDC